jgi:integrase
MPSSPPKRPPSLPPPAPRDADGEPTGQELAPERLLDPALERLARQAEAYAQAALAPATRRAYDADWRHFTRWLERRALPVAPPCPRTVGLYLTACADGEAGGRGRPDALATLERRLAALSAVYARLGAPLDHKDPRIAAVMTGLRALRAAPPRQKEAVLPAELAAMLAALDPGALRGLRDRAILLLGFCGALRRSELVGLDLGRDQTPDGRGWIELHDAGLLLTLRGKTGWREVEVGRGASPATCPVLAVRRWIAFARIAHGPLFRRVGRAGRLGPDRLDDRHVARLVKAAALAAGLRPGLPEAERAACFAGHSLRAGLATSAQAEERHVQKHLGHASPDMTRRYQRQKDRFKINLTQAAGL